MQEKPFSQACENNKAPILAVIREYFADCHRVLEVGSGTGQHAAYFAGQLPYLVWQASDVAAHLPGIEAWRADASLPNQPPAITLDVNGDWPSQQFDGVFSANTAHIMSWPEVQCCFAGVSQVLKTGGHFCLYGPFNFDGQYTSDSNRQFDAMLRARDPESGIRDFSDLNQLAKQQGLHFVADHPMPANNRVLVWRRQLVWGARIAH